MTDARILQVSCPLGADVFALDSVSGSEGLSQLFAFTLELASADHAIAPKDVVGKPMGFTLKTAGLGDRPFHGRVSRFAAGEVDSGGLRRYRAELVPWLWFLSKRRGCRIFQGKTAVAIAEELFGELGFSDYKVQVRAALPTLEYCVQYRESDLQFVSRLFEEFGIFYFFEHSATAETLVLADAKTAFSDCTESKVKFSSEALVENHVTRWERGWGFTSGKWTVRDYDFTKSGSKLESSTATVVNLPGISKYEVYDHPGLYRETPQGDSKVKAYMEGEEATHDLARGESTCASFRPGGKFALGEHPAAGENKSWTIVRIQHACSEPSVHGAGGGYRNSFECLPATQGFRPPLVTPRPTVHGLQTALVVGPAGEELYTNEHGQIRVQFHWDRTGKKDADSSCWIRVAQPWAGKSFGAFHLPRIGQEVVVAFLEGDPDRPLVVGSVYNDVQAPPFALPANKTQTGLRTRSSKGGGAAHCNELRFEDLKGSEQVFLHAEKDELHEVEHDQSLDVGHNQSIAVGNDCSEQIGHDRTLTVKNNQSDTIDKDKRVSVGGNHDESVGGAQTVSVTKGRSLSVGEDLSEDVTENLSCTVGKNASTSAGENMTIEVGKDLSITVSGNQTEDVTKNLAVTAKKVQISGADELTLSAGSASITLKKNGDITIKGKKISIDGSGDVVVKGSKVALN